MTNDSLDPLVPLTCGAYYDPVLDVTIVTQRQGREKHRAAVLRGGHVLTSFRPYRRDGPISEAGAAEKVRTQLIKSICENITVLALMINPERIWVHIYGHGYPRATRCGLRTTYEAKINVGDIEEATCPTCIGELWRVVSVAPFLRPEERA